MVNLSIPKDVVTKARELGINMSEAATRALRKEIRQRLKEVSVWQVGVRK